MNAHGQMGAKKPPNNGPVAIPVVIAVPNHPMARPRSVYGVISPRMAIETGLIRAKPKPWSIREPRKTLIFGDMAQVRDPRAYKKNPDTIVLFLS